MRKLVSVQYLRAIAALLVVASHALLYPIDYQDMFYERLGWLGVILFFVVSGFIIVSVTGAERFEPIAFLRRRLLRVVPLYWAFTFFAALMALLVPALFKTTVFDFGQLVLSLVFIPFYNPASHGYHPLYKLGWTLNYEMYFYLCFALVAFLTARKRVVVLTVVFTLLAVYGFVFKPDTALPGFYTIYMPLAFVVGAWIGLLYIEGQLRALSNKVVSLLAGVAALALLQGFLTNPDYYADPLAFIGLVSFSGIVLLMLVARAASVPQSRLLEYLGDASYSIYLAHIFAIGVIGGAVMRLFGAANGVVIGGAVLGALLGGVLIGVVVYEIAEKPLMKRLRRLG
jgi:exopolysaccharide production protein ExoZ